MLREAIRPARRAGAACLVQLCLLTSGLAAGEVRVRLTPATDRIQVLDTLHVKVSLENGERRAVAVSPRMANLYGTVGFELKAEGEKEFTHVRLSAEGLMSLKALQPVWVGPGKRWVAYETLAAARDEGFFPGAGRYQLRAWVALSDERQRKVRVTDVVRSEPVEIEVAERPKREKELILKSPVAAHPAVQGYY